MEMTECHGGKWIPVERPDWLGWLSIAGLYWCPIDLSRSQTTACLSYGKLFIQ